MVSKAGTNKQQFSPPTSRLSGKNMKTYKIQDREAGNVFENGLTYEEAKNRLAEFEYEDKKFGIYEEGFYELVEEKIYRVQLVFDDEIAISKDDKVTVYATENEQDAKRVFEKLSENKNLKYVLK